MVSVSISSDSANVHNDISTISVEVCFYLLIPLYLTIQNCHPFTFYSSSILPTSVLVENRIAVS